MGFSVTNRPTLKLTVAGVLLAALAACGSSSGNDGPIEGQPDEVTIEADLLPGFTEALGQHALEEMKFLPDFLPTLFQDELVDAQGSSQP